MNALHIILLLGVVGQTESRFVQVPDQDSKAESAERLAYMKKSAGAIRLSFGSDEKETVLKLQPDPIFRSNTMGFSNGGLFLWTVNGRPQAVAEIIFTTKSKTWRINFQSLSTQELSAQRDGKAIWTPSSPGIELKRIKEVEPPSESKVHRLSQMKSIARNFNATVTNRRSGKNALRLLPKPLYRYEDIAGDLLDGAFFCLVLGTSAEAILLLEARKTSTGAQWHYGLAPMSPCATDATYMDKPVWSVPFHPRPQPRDLPFYVDYRVP